MTNMQYDCFGIVGAHAPTLSRRVNTLSPLEREVVALAGREPMSSLATTKRPIVRALFGIEPTKALADPRLEALRRFVVLHRHGRREAEAGGQVLIDLGFSARVLADVRALVTTRHATR